jgi:hypothetical protein
MNKDQEQDPKTPTSSNSLSDRVNDSDSKTSPPATVRRVRLIHVLRRRAWIIVVVVLLAISAVALTLLLSAGSSSQEGRPVPTPTGEAVPAPSGDTSRGMQPRPG